MSHLKKDASPMEKMRAMFSRKQYLLNKSVASAASLNWSSGGRKSSATQADMALSLDAAPTSHLVKLSFSLQVGSIMKSPDPAPQGVEMESEIWSRLSPELVCKILACLPVSSLLRFRSVCKEWETTISSPVFVKSLSTPELPWLFLCSSFNCRETCCAYNPTFNKWHTIPLTSLPSPMRFPLTAVGGLLFVRGGQSKVGILTVCNPVTGSWRELPCMVRKRLNPLVGIVEEPRSRSFKIIVAGGTSNGEMGIGTEYQCTTEVYDSVTDSWTITGPLPRDYTVKMTAWTSKTVFCCNNLYCLTSGRPYNIMAYNLEQGSWSELKVPQPDHLFSSFLLEREDRLLLVGGVGTARSCHKVVMWELQMDCQQWVEVARMPERFFKKFFREKNSADLKCAGNRHLVYFFKDSHTQVMVCDLSRMPACWRWLPCCPLSFYFQRFAIKGLFVEPRLDASADVNC